MNMKNLLFNLIILFLVYCPITAFAVQDVYEYENKQGVTEFTDRIKPDQNPASHIQIEKRTAEQEAQGQAKLDAIVKKDQEFDKQIAEQKQIEIENRQRRQELNNQRAEQQAADNKDDYDDNRYGYYDRYYRPIPGRPIHRPKPVHPIEKPKPDPKPPSIIPMPNPSHPFNPLRSK